MKLSKNQREKIKQIVGKCEHEGCEEKDLEVHRVNRKGEYCLRNIKILCKKHHRMYHGNEFRNVQGKWRRYLNDKMEVKQMQERKREDDVGATKMNERLKWGVEMVKEIAEEYKFEFNESLFRKGLEAGISMFIQSEKR